jgi:hypothetical protein
VRRLRDLLQIAEALDAHGLLSRAGQRWQENADEHGDDPDDDEEFDEGKCGSRNARQL